MNFNLSPEKLEELRKLAEQYKAKQSPKAAPKVAPKVVPKVAPKAAPKAAPKVASKVAPRVAPKVAPKTISQVGPDLWKELHLRALKNKGQDEKVYLTNFVTKIPRYTTGCKCREFWANYVRTHPPKYGRNGEFFEWTVAVHTAVNHKLGKPTYTLEQARKYYENLL